MLTCIRGAGLDGMDSQSYFKFQIPSSDRPPKSSVLGSMELKK